MWDLLVLTAGSERQRQNFELILGEVNTSPYCRKTMVIADYPPNVKIGSGGATLNVLRIIEESTCGKKVLLIHSGGLSQRTPQLSAFGKVFATLPNGSTVLEMKLRSYKSLSTALPAGLLVSASDVLEDTSMFRDCSADSDMILFATESTLKVASNHGVFVMRDGQLVSVLQKPSLDLIRSSGAVLPSGNVLTDCFYWMSWRVCKQLTSLWTSRGPCLVETCCYGDFMRPLGSQPALDYLETGNAELSSWRKALFHVFSRITPEIINLGSDAFFHLGTSQEILEHCTIESTFSKKFLERFDYNVYCDNKEVETGSGSLMEYCRVNGAQIGKGCIVSGCESKEPFKLQDYSLLFTLCIGNQRYTTVLLYVSDEVKARKPNLRWMGKETGLRDVSLWEAKLFPIERSRAESLKATLKLLEGLEEEVGEKVSIAEAVARSDLREMLDYRRGLKASSTTRPPPSSSSP
ncbi:hypothetical protein Q1695_015410 [Nippostrongylus brasiliensis]|nr:hypothetical protein Q1695_015410 [Nippostrongylus brasiliensis]